MFYKHGLNKSMVTYIGVYRRNLSNEQAEWPTPNMVAIDNTDYNVGGTENYQINIRHCRGNNNEYGFMANVAYRRNGVGCHNGAFYVGTTLDIYNKAIKNGQVIAEKLQVKLDDVMKRYA